MPATSPDLARGGNYRPTHPSSHPGYASVAFHETGQYRSHRITLIFLLAVVLLAIRQQFDRSIAVCNEPITLDQRCFHHACFCQQVNAFSLANNGIKAAIARLVNLDGRRPVI